MKYILHVKLLSESRFKSPLISISHVLFFFVVIIISLFVTSCQELNSVESSSDNVQEKRTPPTKEQLVKKREVIERRKNMRSKKSNTVSVLKNVQELTTNGYEDKGSFAYPTQNFFGGMVKEIVVNRANSNQIVLATETSGAWVGLRNVSGEVEWQPIDDDHAETAWETVVQHPTNDDIFFFGSRYDGLHYVDLSLNNGLIAFSGSIQQLINGNLTMTNNINFEQVNILKADPLDMNYIYVAGGTKTFINSNGNVGAYNNVYRFDGVTATIATQQMWTDPATEGDKTRFGDIEILSPETFIVGHKKRIIRFSTDPTLYKVWNGPNGNPYIELDKLTDPMDATQHILYSQHIDHGSSGSRHIYQSIDEGETWSALLTGSTLTNYHSWILEVIPLQTGQHILFSGSVNISAHIINTNFDQEEPILHTLDGTDAHVDYHSAVLSGDNVYVVTDGGVHTITRSAIESHVSALTNLSFSSLNKYFSGSLQVNNVGFSERGEHYSCGVWHSGSGIQDPILPTLELFSHKDGFETCFQPRSINRFYTSEQSGNVLRGVYNSTYNQYGHYPISFSNFNSNKASGFATKIFTHPGLPSKLFGVGETGIHRCENASSATFPITNQDYVAAIWNEPYTVTHNIYQNGIYDASFSDWDYMFYYGLTNNENNTKDNPANEIEFYRINNVNAGVLNPVLLSNLTISNSGQGLTAVDVCKHINFPAGTFYAGIHLEGSGFGIYKIENAHSSGSETIQLVGSTTDLNNLELLEIFVSPFNDDVILVGTNFGLFSSIDGGSSYMPVLDVPAVRIKDLKYEAAQNLLYIGTYGRGVWSAKINNEINDCAYISEVSFAESDGAEFTITDDPSFNEGYKFTDQSSPNSFIKDLEFSFYLRLNTIDYPGAKFLLTAPDGNMTEYDINDMLDIPEPFPGKPWISLRKLYVDIAHTDGDMSDWKLDFIAPSGEEFDVAHVLFNYVAVELNSESDCDGDGLTNSEELELGRNPENFNDFGFELNADNQHWIREGAVYRTFIRNWGIEGWHKWNNGYINSHSFNFDASQLDGIRIRFKSQKNGLVRVYAQDHESGNFVLIQSKNYTGNNSWNTMTFNWSASATWANLHINSLRIEFPDAGNTATRSYLNWIRPILPAGAGKTAQTKDQFSNGLLDINQNRFGDIGLQGDSTTEQILAFPNPAYDLIQLNSADYKIEAIYDSRGALIQTNEHNSSISRSMNVSHLPEGMYMVKAVNKDRHELFVKFVKQ